MKPLIVPGWQPTPPVLETEVQKQITELLLIPFGFRVWWIKQEYTRKRSRGKRTKGPSDIYAVHPTAPNGRRKGICVWIECKGIETGRETSEGQDEFAEQVIAAGGQVIIGKNNIESRGGYTEVCEALKSWGLAKNG